MNPVLCVDVGGTSTKAAILREAALTDRTAIHTIPTRPPIESYIENLAGLIEGTLAGTGVARLGIAVAGFLDDERSRLVYNPNLPWLESFPLKQELSRRFTQVAIELEVDSNAATVAEYRFGSGNGSRRFLCVTVGTGIGVGMTVNGVPLRFAYGCLGDLGHVIVDRDGPLCACGGRGCAEIMVSAPVLAMRYREASGVPDDATTLRDVIMRAQNGEPAAVSTLERAGEWLGLAIASMSNILFPDHIAFAGGLSAAGDLVLAPAERIFRHSASELAREKASFTLATLGAHATLVGAGWPFWDFTS